jgi:Rad3-related DNA helicase
MRSEVLEKSQNLSKQCQTILNDFQTSLDFIDDLIKALEQAYSDQPEREFNSPILKDVTNLQSRARSYRKKALESIAELENEIELCDHRLR